MLINFEIETGKSNSYKIKAEVDLLGHGRVCPTERNQRYIEYSSSDGVWDIVFR